ncbi:MAG TPA: HAD family hydrolase [Thermoanaerobaculia bacterium]|nr:HAD family hydrolase [Thermoanaerobaculia bacterium]
MPPIRLVLFDIDGTLVDCGPQVKPLFTSALVAVFGTAGDVDSCDFAGRTDTAIALDLLTGAGCPRHEVLAALPRIRDLYLANLERELEARHMRLLPGVAELLADLAGRADLALGLLTGNWEPGARTKLSRFGLNRFFAFGAYGCDGIERTELPPVALARARSATGRAFTPAETLIVGDSRHDVSCARAHGIRSLAVATGRTPAAALHAAGADRVVPDLLAAGDCVSWFAADAAEAAEDQAAWAPERSTG